jgi:hypothetical protein
MASDTNRNNRDEEEECLNESYSKNNLKEYLIRKCSMFDSKQKCKHLFESIVQSVEGTFSEVYEQEVKYQLNLEHELERQLSNHKNQIDCITFFFSLLFIFSHLFICFI